MPYRLPVIGFVLICLAVTFSFAARAEDDAVPPLRSKKPLFFVYLGSVLIDREVPAISSLPANRPFKAIHFAVRGLPQEHELAEFAQRVMGLRLEELGITGQLHVLIEPGPGIDPPYLPAGVTSCDTLWASLVFGAAVGENATALTATLFGAQDSPKKADDFSECLDHGAAAPQVLASWPRTILVQGAGGDAILREARRQIVELIDAEIVSKIVNTNHVAKTMVESWSRSAN